MTPEEEGYRIHVADLGIDCSKRELESNYEKYGEIIEVWLARNPPCFAFIVYKNKEDADEAIKETDGEIICDSRVRVSYARPRTRGRRSRGFDPNLRCYQCGIKGHFSRDCRGGYSRSYGYSRSSYNRYDNRGRRDDFRRDDYRDNNRDRSRSRSRDRRRSDDRW